MKEILYFPSLHKRKHHDEFAQLNNWSDAHT